MRIQMIDLLVAIAKGEEIPKMIKYKSKTYSYDELEKDYKNSASTNDWLFESYLITNILFDAVEIIEEPKKIEKIPLPSFDEFKRMSAEERYVITAKEYDLLDELIEEINNLKENK